jgi:hypothetical protein
MCKYRIESFVQLYDFVPQIILNSSEQMANRGRKHENEEINDFYQRKERIKYLAHFENQLHDN